ncbi:septation ring formation regulator EzrA [Alkalihalophilus pseudofirmus]|uniref:Septation ring formation regulator EzrA n=1 Tax=Alkalihalophilus pseudofirmus TaxID=79885 RepID=A0AAJ2NP93_ALKPS|nr:septation ring formation regulator EzrA [Alkalihalophilus pseudofirmus]MDV2885948.1 septation ring formation regulator EzrA [Alkalihalophilus pseudofirmus]WEG16244.1 septation ring formation regulator EzrA [Alkalihalophilus pseudofirmus]
MTMYVIYAAIAVIAVLFVIGMVFRKNIYKEVDKLDDWKNTILNRDIPSEIGKVKNLHMSGETEEKFELWRSEWDEIVGGILPNIEEQLFDIEEAATKYRFKKAKELIALTTDRLNGIETQLQVMVEEINQLVTSAEQNSTEIGSVKDQFHTVMQQVLKKRGSLGVTVETLDEKLAHTKQLLEDFDQATEEGSYLKAREYLREAKEEVDLVRLSVEKVPALLVQLKTTIPQEVRQLILGIEDMENSGYCLEPFALMSKIESITNENEQLLADISTLEEIESMEEKAAEVTAQLDQLYEVLETEVEAKQEVAKAVPTMKEQVEQVDEQLTLLMEETTQVQLSYRLAEEEISFQEKVKKQLNELMHQLQLIVDVSENNSQTYTSILDMVEEWMEKIKQIQLDIDKGKQALNDLRQDELDAKETLIELRQKLLESKRLLQKSNIPGLPQEAVDHLDESEMKVITAARQLEQVPLEMGRVNVLVEEALSCVEENEQLIKDTIESAQLAERVIQFANRYRNRSERTRSGLIEAEELFRQYEYTEAIECAYQAVKEFDPSIVEKVSEQYTA